MLKRFCGALLACCLILALAAPAAAHDMGKAGEPNVVSALGSCSAYVDADGALWMWGDNRAGQLGDGTRTSRSTPAKVMDDVVSVSCSGDDIQTNYGFVAAIKRDGSLWMWGGSWQDGEGSLTPAKVMDGVAAVSIGGGHFGAVKTDGSLWMWGNNTYGQLGDGTTESRTRPVKVMDGVAAVDCNGQSYIDFTAAIKTDGSLWMWGDYHAVEMAAVDGNAEVEVVPEYYMEIQTIPAHVMDGVAAVSGTTVLKTDGSLWVWDGAAVVKTMDGAAAVSGSAVIKTDGSLWMWGDNSFGQLGDGTAKYEYRTEPVKVMDGVAAVSKGEMNTLAVKTDGTVWAWGSNEYGQIGNGGWWTVKSLEDRPLQTVPVKVSFPAAAAADDASGWYAYVDRTLAPAMGYASSESETMTVSAAESRLNWSRRDGIAGADVLDLTGDGTEDLLLYYFSDAVLYASLYRRDGQGNVSHGQPLRLHGGGSVGTIRASVNAGIVEVGGTPYLYVESNDATGLISDGGTFLSSTWYTFDGARFLPRWEVRTVADYHSREYTRLLTYSAAETYTEQLLWEGYSISWLGNEEETPPDAVFGPNASWDDVFRYALGRIGVPASAIATTSDGGWPSLWGTDLMKEAVRAVVTGDYGEGDDGLFGFKLVFTRSLTVSEDVKMPRGVAGFGDVHPGDYFADAVVWAVNHTPQITDGVTDTSFAPGAAVTRGQAVTFLWRSQGKPSPATAANPFTDVKPADYYYEAVLWAVENGITDGMTDTTFEPGGTVTRGQMVAFLYRTEGEPGKTDSTIWYADAETWANGKGLLEGTAQSYARGAACPRSDVMTYMYRDMG